jgi:hypothetical protein
MFDIYFLLTVYSRDTFLTSCFALEKKKNYYMN